MSARALTVVHLYPVEADASGDHGNVRFWCQRARLYGYDVEVRAHMVGDDPAMTVQRADVVVGGTAPDVPPSAVVSDLAEQRDVLRTLVEDGLPVLVVGGLYQLFGNLLRTPDGETSGIGVFDAETVVGSGRLVGNTVVRTDLGEVVGYENHSGRTVLHDGQMAFGTVPSGAGNNGDDQTEGAHRHHAFGTYLTGPVLPKNPLVADELLRLAVARKYGDHPLVPRDDEARARLERLDDLARKVRQTIKGRPR